LQCAVEWSFLDGLFAGRDSFLGAIQLQQDEIINNRFKIIEILSQSDSCVICRAADHLRLQNVILKFYPISGDNVDAFFNKVTLASIWSHPYIHNLQEGFISDNYLTVVCEFAEGKILTEIIRKKSLPIIIIMDWMIELTKGLEFLHRKNMFHGHLYPNNILISPKGNLKILDIEKILVRDQISWLTFSNQDYGFYSEMSAQEQMVSPHLADIYSVGALFYSLLLGAVITSDNVLLIQSFLKKDGNIFAEKSDVPIIANNIIRKCLRIDDKPAYQNIGELIFDFERFRQDEPFSLISQQLVAETKRSQFCLEDLEEIEEEIPQKGTKKSPQDTDTFLKEEAESLFQSTTAKISQDLGKALAQFSEEDSIPKDVFPLENRELTPSEEPGLPLPLEQDILNHNSVLTSEEVASDEICEEKQMLTALLAPDEEPLPTFTLPSEPVVEPEVSSPQTAPVAPVIPVPPEIPASVHKPKQAALPVRQGVSGLFPTFSKILLSLPHKAKPLIAFYIILGLLFMGFLFMVFTFETKVFITSFPNKAAVFIDGKEIAVTPLTYNEIRFMHPHSIKLKKDGYETIAKTLIGGFQDSNLFFPLIPLKGLLTVSSIPDSDVYIDGKLIGSTPIENYAQPWGTYSIKIVHDEYFESDRKIEIEKGEQKVVRNIFQGCLQVQGDEAFELQIDGELKGTIRKPQKFFLDKKTYRVTLLRDGYVLFDDDINIQPAHISVVESPKIAYLQLVSTPSVKIEIEGRDGFYETVPQTPAKVALAPGKYNLVAYFGKKKIYEESIKLKRNKEMLFEKIFTAKVFVRVRSRDKVFIDEKFTTVNPRGLVALPLGDHAIKIVRNRCSSEIIKFYLDHPDQIVVQENFVFDCD